VLQRCKKDRGFYGELSPVRQLHYNFRPPIERGSAGVVPNSGLAIRRGETLNGFNRLATCSMIMASGD